MQLGADPEFILVRGRSPYSAIGLVGGSKIEPLKVKHGALQEDNVLAEINIAPARDENHWNFNLVSVMRQLREKLPKRINISKLASANYHESQLHPEKAKTFGCDPDFNAWEGVKNKLPPLPFPGFRTAGGHVHVGIDGLSIDAKYALIRCMDTVIGLQSVILDKDSMRRKLYGKAGSMRDKYYGVEWRTPSNFWVFEAYSRRWMFNAAMYCAENFKDIRTAPDVAIIINENLVKEAAVYLKFMGRDFPIHKGAN